MVFWFKYFYVIVIFLKGNQARKIFANPKKSAEILRIPEYIVSDLGKIWKILTCGHPINADKFGKVCDDFKTKFMNDDRVNFYEFNPTIHKGSIHILHFDLKGKKGL